jgi:hypothetical protein
MWTFPMFFSYRLFSVFLFTNFVQGGGFLYFVTKFGLSCFFLFVALQGLANVFILL